MKKYDFKQQLTFGLAFTGITWLIMSLLIFFMLSVTFTWDIFFNYFLVSVLIGAYALFLLNKGHFFSRVFFISAYVVGFFGLYYGASSSGSSFGRFAPMILMFIPLISISVIGVLIDLNISMRKKSKEIEKGPQ